MVFIHLVVLLFGSQITVDKITEVLEMKRKLDEENLKKKVTIVNKREIIAEEVKLPFYLLLDSIVHAEEERETERRSKNSIADQAEEMDGIDCFGFQTIHLECQ